MACGLLLSTRSLKMVFHPIEGTYLGIPIAGSSMAFFLTMVTNKGCLA
jgi:hypothetical protein